MNVSYKRGFEGRGSTCGKRIKKSFVQYPKYWQEHGDIEVRVETVRFKIQSYHLVNSSSWFLKWYEKMRKEQETDEEEEEDSAIPVASLQGMAITATDFAELLNALNHAMCVPSPPSSVDVY